nr:hypothetical protein HK105_008351 [Polyrhizophydium stewartii]
MRLVSARSPAARLDGRSDPFLASTFAWAQFIIAVDRPKSVSGQNLASCVQVLDLCGSVNANSSLGRSQPINISVVPVAATPTRIALSVVPGPGSLFRLLDCPPAMHAELCARWRSWLEASISPRGPGGARGAGGPADARVVSGSRWRLDAPYRIVMRMLLHDSDHGGLGDTIIDDPYLLAQVLHSMLPSDALNHLFDTIDAAMLDTTAAAPDHVEAQHPHHHPLGAFHPNGQGHPHPHPHVPTHLHANAHQPTLADGVPQQNAAISALAASLAQGLDSHDPALLSELFTNMAAEAAQTHNLGTPMQAAMGGPAAAAAEFGMPGAAMDDDDSDDSGAMDVPMSVVGSILDLHSLNADGDVDADADADADMAGPASAFAHALNAIVATLEMSRQIRFRSAWHSLDSSARIADVQTDAYRRSTTRRASLAISAGSLEHIFSKCNRIQFVSLANQSILPDTYFPELHQYASLMSFAPQESLMCRPANADTVIEALVAGCPGLIYLDVQSCDWFQPCHLRYLLARAPSLRAINLVGCSKLPVSQRMLFIYSSPKTLQRAILKRA